MFISWHAREIECLFEKIDLASLLWLTDSDSIGEDPVGQVFVRV